MDLKEYWEKPIPKVSGKYFRKERPIRCHCGKKFVDMNAWDQHVRFYGKKGHGLNQQPDKE